MATTLGGGFNITSNELVDSRFILTASNQRFSFEQARMGIGLTTYASESRKYFILTDSESYTTNAGWSSIAISDNNNTESFTFVSTSISSASITSGTFGAIDLPLWGDLSYSLSIIEEAAGGQDFDNVLATGRSSGRIPTSSAYMISSSIGSTNGAKPTFTFQDHVAAPEPGSDQGVIRWQKRNTDTTSWGDFARISLQYTRKVGLQNGAANQPTGSSALIFQVAPVDGGIRGASTNLITPLVLSGSKTDPRAEFHSADFNINPSGYAARTPRQSVVISGGSGSVHPPYISPIISGASAHTMKFGSGSAGYTLDFNNNVARFNQSFISGSSTGTSVLKLHSGIHEFRHSSATDVKIYGNISSSKALATRVTGSFSTMGQLTSSAHVSTDITASAAIKVGGTAVTDPSIAKGTENFLRVIGKGIDLDQQTSTPTAVAGAIMFSASNGEGAFYLGVTF
jgi:hypothetical protein